MRGIAGAFERAWSGAPGTIAWTEALLPLAWAYGAASAAARRRARARRRSLEGARVLAIGNLTAGGTGKTTVARWVASEAAKAGVPVAVLLRGYGARPPEPGVLPDFAAYPLEERAGRYGDEAIALRRALPRGATVAAHPDRWRSARAARQGYGARLLVLDDGWEQPGLRWDELWVTLDPERPIGNGALLPAGPLRRPPSTLREATRVLFVLEAPEEHLPPRTIEWLGRAAPGAPILRLQRRLLGPELPRRGTPLAVISGIGAPHRLERLIRGAGLDLRWHETYPDHARWSETALRDSLRRVERAGAESVWITEKDAPRWPSGMRPSLPVRVLRAGIEPLDSVEEALHSIEVSP